MLLCTLEIFQEGGMQFFKPPNQLVPNLVSKIFGVGIAAVLSPSDTVLRYHVAIVLQNLQNYLD